MQRCCVTTRTSFRADDRLTVSLTLPKSSVSNVGRKALCVRCDAVVLLAYRAAAVCVQQPVLICAW